MTELVCIDTRFGSVRRYERATDCGANNARCTHQVQVSEWPKFQRGEYCLDKTAIARFLLSPELFVERT